MWLIYTDQRLRTVQLYTVVDNLPRAEDVDADAELSFDPATGTTLAALGTGASVPRFLRGANVVPITVWSKSHTISTVRRLLQSKASMPHAFLS
jgi:hypothetical protein